MVSLGPLTDLKLTYSEKKINMLVSLQGCFSKNFVKMVHTLMLSFKKGLVVPPEGVLRFELDRGVPLELQNPYPSLRVIVAEKGTHF